VKRAYQYRLYPTKKQVGSLEHLLVAGQRLYNASLEHRLVCWRRFRRPIWYLDQASDLKAIRKEDANIGVRIKASRAIEQIESAKPLGTASAPTDG